MGEILDFNSKAYQFANFIVHELEGYIENLHLIEYEQGMLLVDSGCINDIKRIEEYCENIIKRPVTDIKLIIVTHLHPDHAGGAVKLRAKYNIPIAAHKDLDNWYRGFGGFLQHKIDCNLALLVAYRSRKKIENIYYKRKIEPDYGLEDGSTLPGFPDWQVLHVPGHTLYDLVTYNANQQMLFVADLICDVKGKTRLPIPILFPDKMLNSFERLAKLPIRTIFRSHGQLIVTDNNYKIFMDMKKLTIKPLTPMARKYRHIFYFAPIVRETKKRA